MKIFPFVVAVGMLLGCDRCTHVISVDRLKACQEINVLYVGYAEPYRLATSSRKSSLSRIVRGGAYYKIDLSKVKVDKVAAKRGEAITVEMPALYIDSYPDPSRSEEYDPGTGLLVTDSGLNRIREAYDAMDRKKISKGTDTPEYRKMAKEQAEKIIRKMLPELAVEIKWEE